MSYFRFALLLVLPMCNTPAPTPAAATSSTVNGTPAGSSPVGAASAASPAASNAAPNASATATAAIQIEVNGSGYNPAEVTAPAGKTVQLVFTRTSEEGCGQQLVFPSLNLKRDLPLNQPVPVEVTMPATGNIAFTCGMDMYRGAIVAQ